MSPVESSGLDYNFEAFITACMFDRQIKELADLRDTSTKAEFANEARDRLGDLAQRMGLKNWESFKAWIHDASEVSDDDIVAMFDTLSGIGGQLNAGGIGY